MFAESKCVKCGKLFIPAPQHALVDYRGYYCSCTCFLHRNDGVQEEKRGAKPCKVERYTKDGKYMKTYKDAKQAAFEVDGNDKSLARAIRTGTLYRQSYWKYAEKELDDGRA